MKQKYFLTSSLSRKFIAGGLAAVFGAGVYGGHIRAVCCCSCCYNIEHCVEEWNDWDLKEKIRAVGLTFVLCIILIILFIGFPYVAWNIVHESKVSEKSTKGKSSQREESGIENLEDETQILNDKQYAPLIVRLALRATMMAAGAATAVALTKKFSGGYKNSNSLKSEKCEKLKKSESDPDNSDKAESVLPLSHEVNDERKKEQIGQKSGDENK